MTKVEVIAYDSNWPKHFDVLAESIRSALGQSCVSVHHVGSTSVPGLAAKPKIDIIAEVDDLNFTHHGLEKQNYEYRGGFNIPLRKSFTRRGDGLSVNLHIFEKGDPEVELNLLFRDYLRNNPAARDEYAALKYELLQEESSHQQEGALYKGYTLGKNDFIEGVIKETGFNGLRFMICTHYSEWEAVKRFRETYFFTPNKVDDPYTWTFEHKDHKHLVLYQGVKIVGYAHIQLWPDHRAAIRIIVVDEHMRNQSLGRQFMELIEKWLKLEGYKSLHTESSPQALEFYTKLAYVPMPFNDPDGYEGGADDVELGKIL